MPRLIVLRAIPVARAVALTPPCPRARASLAANRRRPRSSRSGATNCQRNRMSLTLITASGDRQATASHLPNSRFYCCVLNVALIRLFLREPLADPEEHSLGG